VGQQDCMSEHNGNNNTAAERHPVSSKRSGADQERREGQLVGKTSWSDRRRVCVNPNTCNVKNMMLPYIIFLQKF
jgi:hypothetical protein